jgi:hypothetical protein
MRVGAKPPIHMGAEFSADRRRVWSCGSLVLGSQGVVINYQCLDSNVCLPPVRWSSAGMSRSEVQPGLITTITTHTEPEVRNCTPPSLRLSGIDSRVLDKQLRCANTNQITQRCLIRIKHQDSIPKFSDTELRDPSDLA